jgi:hypothetical protein
VHARGIRAVDGERRAGAVLVDTAAAVVFVLVLAVATSVTAADARAGHATGSGCSAFGPTWARSYNARAIVTGNPVRILAACCQPTGKVGINHCFVTVTLAGTIDRGCELVDIGPSGLPAGPGEHERCSGRQQTA